ncbi:flagellar filament capping protein FliD [Janthinobacterium fluminis]|uniref:Flagellar hook-associated protein 2 n=1 Tax=Janthinobacterium fluminis TaxID=2987524 RepID=A0ABT5K348_9BURK|nr:flagellar filament capping protein FliD [Janthinobacterium fluminis]MDC8759299.1 flagellar filament capping protein FliD [Janthinobacterium fluminis]
MAITSTGGVLDVNDIVNKLMTVESRPFLAMQNKEKAYTAQMAAYGTLSGALGSFQTSVTALADNSKFKTISAVSSESGVVTASAGKEAVKGSYSVNVTQMAQAQTLTSAGQASTTALIGSGATTKLTFEFGSISGGTLSNGTYTGATFTQDPGRAARSVTIDSSNNSLQGIRDAINKAGVGVTATIVSDGSASPNRLVLTSNQTGDTASMRIAVAGDAAVSDLLSYAPEGTQKLTQNNVAQNAKVTINGVAVTSPSNEVTGAIQGVTLTAAKVGLSTVAVNSDTSGMKTVVTNFVKAYNELSASLKELTAVVPNLKPGAPKAGGPLQGESTATSLQGNLRKLFVAAVPGLNGNVTSLSQLGVAFQKDGTLKLDSAKLQKAIDATPDDVAKLLATSGSVTDSLVSFVSSTSKSEVGTRAISIAQLATKGSLTGGAAADLTIVKGVNDELSMTVNGVTTNTILVAGTYTADTLATHVQSMINGALGVTGTATDAGITMKQNAGVLTATSNRYGSVSKIAISGNASSSLFGTPTTVDGLDVTGTIGGEPASGSGQLLTGTSGSGSAGIQVKIDGGTTGDRGTVNISKGIAAQFAALVDGAIGTDGSIPGKNKGITKSLTDIEKQRKALDVRLTETEKRYRRQYSALDVTLSKMQSTNVYLGQQLAALSTIR